MPVTTRAQSRRLQDAESQRQLAHKQPNATREPSKSINTATRKGRPALEGFRSPVQTTSQASKDSSPSQASSQTKSRYTFTETPGLDLPSTIGSLFWSCQKCPCQEGEFEGIVNSCVACKHTMDDHGLDWKHQWRPTCDYLCRRERLVTSVLQRTRDYGVMVVRATPMVGKTSLLKLLGYHVVHNERDLEPVYVNWETRERRNGLAYDEYLQREKARRQRMNAEYRPRNPHARTIYLIDEAQGSYEDENFWSMLKDHHNTRMQDLFVLVCVYGAAGVSYKRDPNVESQAQRMHALQRVELRPTTAFGLCMLFRKEEVDLMVRQFAVFNHYQLGPGITEYIYSATDGHPGMVGLLLSHIWNLSKSVSSVDTRVYGSLTFFNRPISLYLES